MTQARGELYDIGYQPYLGPREGRSRARKAVWSSGVRTVLGMGRGVRAKVLPALLCLAAVAPALFFTMLVVIMGPVAGAVSHAEYYQLIALILVLFSAIMAPELLCPDRRDRVIDLYIVRPLTSVDYLAARWLAFLAVTLSIAYAGQVVLFVGFTLAAEDQVQYLRDNWLDVPRFLLAGLVIAAFTTTLPMAVSAFTTRRAYATAFVIGLYLISVTVAGALTVCQEGGNGGEGGLRVTAGQEADAATGECERLAGDGAKWFALVALSQVPAHVNALIFDERNDNEDARLVAELPQGVLVTWYLLITAGPGAVLWWRYSRLGR